VVSRVHSMAMMRVKSTAVTPSKQQGTSLIELMVASVIGVFAISIIGSVFITGQRIAKDKGIELLLLQNLTSTMQVMKEDIQRAGYDGSNGYSIKLSGASNTIQVSGGVAVGFVYFREGSNGTKIFEISFIRKMEPSYKFVRRAPLYLRRFLFLIRLLDVTHFSMTA